MKIAVALGMAALSFALAAHFVLAAETLRRAQTHDFTTAALVVRGLAETGPKRAGAHEFRTDGLVVLGLASGPKRAGAFDFKTDPLVVRGIAK
jgi:hypothetical protein